MDAVIRVHGVPRMIVSDRDTRCTSSFWRGICRVRGTTLAMSFGFPPQIDGQTERANRSIEDMMRAYMGRRQNYWDERLGMIGYAYNNSVHSSSGYSPFYTGTEPSGVKKCSCRWISSAVGGGCGSCIGKSRGLRIGKRDMQIDGGEI